MRFLLTWFRHSQHIQSGGCFLTARLARTNDGSGTATFSFALRCGGPTLGPPSQQCGCGRCGLVGPCGESSWYAVGAPLWARRPGDAGCRVKATRCQWCEGSSFFMPKNWPATALLGRRAQSGATATPYKPACASWSSVLGLAVVPAGASSLRCSIFHTGVPYWLTWRYRRAYSGMPG